MLKRQNYYAIHNRELYSVIQLFVKTSLRILNRQLIKENNYFKSYIDIDEYRFVQCREDISFRSKINYEDEEVFQVGCFNLVSKHWKILENTKTLQKSIERLLLIDSINNEFLNSGYSDKTGKRITYGRSYKEKLINYMLRNVVSYYLYLNLGLDFKQQTFDEAFFQVQDYLYGNYNFRPFIFFTLIDLEIETDKIILFDDVVLRKINDFERLNNDRFDRIESNEEYQFVFQYNAETRYNRRGDPIQTFDDAYFKLNRLINGLKLYKEGRISIVNRIEKRFDSDPDILSKKFIQRHYSANPYYYKNYIITKDEIEYLQKFLKKYFEIFNDPQLSSMMDIPIYRFCRINDATNLENRVIDLFIALESLFSRDEQSLEHRISSRVSFVIGDGKNNKKLYSFLKVLYSIRSRIVHGDTYEKELKKINKIITFEEAIQVLDKLTRICIRKYLNLIINLKITKKDSLIEIIDDNILSANSKFLKKNNKGFFDVRIENIATIIDALNKSP